jgi:NTE family protein
VPLDRAVSSSCCVPGLFPPVSIDGSRYIDGGIISASNAFLADGHDTVVVLSVLTGALSAFAEHVSRPLAQEVEALRASGSAVELVEMDQVAFDACGGNLMDFTSVAAVAEAGRVQGGEAAERVGAIWG